LSLPRDRPPGHALAPGRLVALTAEDEALRDDRLFAPGVPARFPGTGWTHALKRLIEAGGRGLMTADRALREIRSGVLTAGEVTLVQHGASADGRKLRALGARPGVLLCLESPLYLDDFYDRLPMHAEGFPWFIGFAGQARRLPRETRFAQVRFPILAGPSVPGLGFDARLHRAVLVAGNKFPRACWGFSSASPRDLMRAALGWRARLGSRALREGAKGELLRLRLRLIDALAPRGLLDLFGAGWSPLIDVPQPWRGRLRAALSGVGPCEDKRSVLSRYRFALCLENTSWPGYLTEKLIDAIAAGCVPLYLGAPDIHQIIPRGALVDLTGKSEREIEDLILGMDASQAGPILEAGRVYLESEAGRLHQDAHFAQDVASKLGLG